MLTNRKHLDVTHRKFGEMFHFVQHDNDFTDVTAIYAIHCHADLREASQRETSKPVLIDEMFTELALERSKGFNLPIGDTSSAILISTLMLAAR